MIKILVLTPQIIYPWWFYGRSSIYFLLNSLVKNGIDIHLSFPVIDLDTHKEDIRHLENIGIKTYPFIHDTKDKVSLLLKNIFEKEPFKIRKYYSEQYYYYLLKISETIKPNIIQVHASHMFKYGFLLSQYYNVPLILRQQDIVHSQVKTFFKETKNPIYKFIATWQYKKTLRYELNMWKYLDKTIFITKQDFDYAINISRINPEKFTYIYDGINLRENIYLRKRNKHKALVFIASDQIPNIISLNWFIDVWKKLSNKINYELHIYGKICNHFEHKKETLENYKIFLKGFIKNPDSLYEIISQYSAFISPTIQGSGYRTKIFEAMSIGLPVICTDFDYKPIEPLFDINKEILVFNNEGDLYEIIKSIDSNPMLLENISRNLFEKIKNNYTFDKTATKFIDIYNDLLKRKIVK